MNDQEMKWDPEKYNKGSSFQYEGAKHALSLIAWQGNEAVLDVGCGDGKITYLIANLVPQGSVLGVDSSESMIDYSKEKYAATKNMRFAVRNAEQLDFDQQFDFVFSSFCLHWVSDKLAAFKGIYRALKPGGKAFLLMTFRDKNLVKIREDLIKEPRWKKYFSDFFDETLSYEDNAYDQYAKRAGLTIDSYHIQETPVIFPSKASMMDFLRNLTPHLKKLNSEQDKSDFITAIVDRYWQIMPPDQKGMSRITYLIAYLKAHR